VTFILDKDIALDNEGNEVDMETKSIEIKGEVSDPLENLLEKNKKADEKQKKFEEEQKRFEADKKKQLRKEKVKAFWQNLARIIEPDFYAGLIQNLENLLFVIFVDTILLSILFSCVYALYIIFSFDDISNIYTGIFKVVGSLLVAIVGIIIQINLNQSKSKSGE
jgi:hypothetical protein